MTQKNDTNSQTYQPPVSQLLTVGDARQFYNWPDYPATYGLTLAHVPDLIRMMQDEDLNWADSDSDEVWAPIHAWRTLGQLRAESAVDTIMDTFHLIDDQDSDWPQEEFPVVLPMIGAAAIPAIKTYLGNDKNGLWSRVTAARSLGKMGQKHADARDDCITILSDQLAHHQQQTPSLNAFLISPLLDLKAVEAAAPMEAAFNADNVDLSVQGDWEEAQIELGLLTERLTPRPQYGWMPKELIPMAKTVRSGTLGKFLTGMEDKPTTEENVGRNDPCPCGSGKKYKKCHGKPGQKNR